MRIVHSPQQPHRKGNTDEVLVHFSLMDLQIGRRIGNTSQWANASAIERLLAIAPREFAERLINSTRNPTSRVERWLNQGFFSVNIERKPEGGGGGGNTPTSGDDDWRERWTLAVAIAAVGGLVVLGLVVVAIIALVRWRRRRFLQTGLSWVLTEEEEDIFL